MYKVLNNVNEVIAKASLLNVAKGLARRLSAPGEKSHGAVTLVDDNDNVIGNYPSAPAKKGEKAKVVALNNKLHRYSVLDRDTVELHWSTDLHLAKGIAMQNALHGIDCHVLDNMSGEIIAHYPAYTQADKQALKADISDKPSKAKAKPIKKPAPAPKPTPVCLAKAIGWYGLIERLMA